MDDFGLWVTFGPGMVVRRIIAANDKNIVVMHTGRGSDFKVLKDMGKIVQGKLDGCIRHVVHQTGRINGTSPAMILHPLP